MDTMIRRRPPSIADWTELDESERLDLVLAYHQRQGDDLPNPDAVSQTPIMCLVTSPTPLFPLGSNNPNLPGRPSKRGNVI